MSAEAASDAEKGRAADAVAANEEAASQGESGKIKMIMSILRQFIGVKDMAAVRFSLPSQLLEPVPNLEYWNYLDRPEYFVSISEPEEELERMLAVIRWLFTKDVKLINGKVCKPYNSVLGEFFRCHWDIDALPSLGVSAAQLLPTDSAETVQAEQKSSRFKPSFSRKSTAASVASTRSASPTGSIESTGGSAGDSSSARGEPQLTRLDKPVRCGFICEQTSHHPPISAFMYSCPEKGITAYGMDQLAAKFTGTSVKVQSGEFNHGIFVNLAERGDEEYQCKHPSASVSGFLRGALYAAIQDDAVITCPKTKLKAIIAYKDDPWIGKPKFAVEGAIFRYEPGKPSPRHLKDVAESDILARIDGCYKKRIYVTPARTSRSTGEQKYLLVDLSDMSPVQKKVPAAAEQQANESRQVWARVTDAMSRKEFTRATREKNVVEDEQRALAKQRKVDGRRHQAVLFDGVDQAGNVHDVDYDPKVDELPGEDASDAVNGDANPNADTASIAASSRASFQSARSRASATGTQRLQQISAREFDGRPRLTAAGQRMLQSQLDA
ncbi:hypothetical protein PYCC9005_003326 [Savitreella phatthalungensis]